MEPIVLGIPISEWFKYHPVKTEERTQEHNKNNELCYNLALAMLHSDWKDAANEYIQELKSIPKLPAIHNWVEELSIQLLAQRSSMLPGWNEKIMFLIQQIRMFNNMDITFHHLDEQ